MNENPRQMRSLVPLMIVLLLAGTAGAVVSTSQSGEYSMSSPSEIEIPARDLTVDGESYTVRAVGRATPGESVQIDVSAPEDAEYSVYLYDRNLRIEQTDAMSGSDRATFSTDDLSPGSYLAAVYDGEILDVYPVVVQGYDLTVEAPSNADGSVTVNVTVADGALTRTPPQVQVVLGDDARSVRTDATRVGDGEYRATLRTDEFEPDTYALYGVVRGEQETEGGDRVILAVSDRHEVRLESTPTSTPTATSSGDGGSGDGGDGGDGGGGQAGGGADGKVTIEAAELLNESVAVDEEAVVRVDLANADPVRGDIVLRLTANRTNVTEERLAVAASTERTVFVRAAFDSPGTYELALGNRSLGSLTVTDVAETPTTTAEATPGGTEDVTPTPTSEGVVTPRPTTAQPEPTTTSDDGAGVGAIGAALAVVLAGLALGRRRR